MKVLNLYAGIGGNRKLWPDEAEVTAVELDPTIAEIYKNYFPDDTVIVGDAHQYLLNHYTEFDFVWSSPPCITHTRMNKNFAKTKNGIGQIPAQQRHRHLYWCNFKITTTGKGNPPKESNVVKKEIRQQGRTKSYIKEDSATLLAKKYGFEPIEKNIYVNGNHSPGQIFRNCVDPEEGLLIFNCAYGIFKSKTIQISFL